MVYLNNPDKQNQCLNHEQIAEPIARRDGFSRKTLLCVWWNFEGVIHHERVPNNRTIDADLYYAQLDRMYARLSRKYPALVNQKRVLLQQDNAKYTPPDEPRKRSKNSTQLNSPDLAPSNYHIFLLNGTFPARSEVR